MRFAFTDDQLAFRDAVRDVLAKECEPAEVRRAWDATAERGPAWSALAGMGVLGTLVPEAVGGLGLTEIDLVLVLEESGYSALPEPLVEHAAVAMPMLAAASTDASRRAHSDILGASLAEALAGTVTITTPFHHDAVVPFSTHADRFLLFADGAWYLAHRDDITLEALDSIDGARHLARVTWDPSRSALVADGDAAGRGFERGALGTAAQLLGLARRMLDMTVRYATERVQFGVPIGSFQAVKHHLADARIAIEFARPLVYRAAWSLATLDPEAPVHISMAKASAADTATLTARQALQCHGAIGYSFEYDLHLFLKRAWALVPAWGDPAWHRARVARAIL